MHSSVAEVRYEGVPQDMEVHDPARAVFRLDLRSFQVFLDHATADVTVRHGKCFGQRELLAELGAQQFCRLWPKRKRVFPPVLGVTRLDSDDRWLGVQVEACRCQCAQLVSAQPRFERQSVQHFPVRPSQSGIGLTGTGRFQQPPAFIRRQRSPNDAPVSVRVHPLHESDGRFTRAPLRYHPLAELLESPDINQFLEQGDRPQRLRVADLRLQFLLGGGSWRRRKRTGAAFDAAVREGPRGILGYMLTSAWAEPSPKGGRRRRLMNPARALGEHDELRVGNFLQIA